MYVYGKNVVNELLNTDKKILRAYISDNFKDIDIVNKLKNKNILIKNLPKYQIDKMVKGLHQGIILDIEDYKYADIDDFVNEDQSLIIILDHLEDPHNLGAIIRTCEAAKISGIIIPKNRSVEVTDTVMKVSVGATENMKIAKVTNIVNTIKELKNKGFWIVGTDMEGTEYTEIDYKGKIVIVIGNEGTGMSRLVSENCDFIASIPMYGQVNSLNASVSTGIMIYEALKQRK